jgi:hypothetical protein
MEELLMSFRSWACLFFAVAVLTAAPVTAQVNVNCGNPGESLQAAIMGLDPWAANVVNVTGTCKETIAVVGFRDLVIKGSGGATIHPPLLLNGEPGYLAMSVTSGSNVRLCGLTLEGAQTGLSVMASLVQAGPYCGGTNNHLIVKDGTTGIALTDNAVLRASLINGLVVENNSVRGIYVNASRLQMQGYLDANQTSTTQIRNNGDSASAPERMRGGICVGEGATAYLYKVDVVDNQGWGVSGVMGSVVHLWDTTVARNAGPGVKLSNNSTGQILASGPGDVAPGQTPPVKPITGNGGGGVLVTERSALRVRNAPVISGNTGGNLVCTASGEAFGTAANIPGIKKDCKTFTTVADD